MAREGSCGDDGGCDYAQRAKRAELSLLALQYSMCQQHCWRRYDNTSGPEFPPANVVSVLQTLETDYKEMRGKILAGMPLDQLAPLSVDSQRITSGARYIPAEDSQRITSGARYIPAELAPQQLLHSRLEKRKVVCDSPTATGTCVPQHYATMGSFGTLMAQLTERHPEVGRHRIVDALLELRAIHQGVLSGLPLKTIVEMTSELLTRPTTSITPL